MAAQDTAPQEKTTPRPSKVNVWLLATRPNTLALSFTPVLVGAAIVAETSTTRDRVRILRTSLQFWVFAALIQIGTNLHNDYSDFVKGADTSARVGQARATQRGWLSESETLRGALGALGAAAAVGFDLALRPHSDLAVMTFVTVTSLFNAVAYTGGYPLAALPGLGRLSLGYLGLGDLFVMLYFGYVATLAPYYLSSPATRRPPLLCAVAATSLGCLATGVMVVNNLRDRRTDVHVGKRTLAVRFGERFARAEYTTLVIAAYAVILAAVVLQTAPPTWLLVFGSLPLARNQLSAVATKDGAALNPHVGGTAKLQLVFGVLLFLGVAMVPSRTSP